MLDYRLILDRIEEIRMAHNWTINELAERAELTSGTIYGWYSKARKKPSLEALAAVAKAFDISVLRLLTQSPEEERSSLVSELASVCDDLSDRMVQSLIVVAKTMRDETSKGK